MILFAGLFSVMNLNREAIPDVTFDMVTIITIFPGASPNDVEELISIPIEKSLRSVSNLDKVRSYNVENVSQIVVFIEDSAPNKKDIIQDIKDAVEQVSGLPESAMTPLVSEVKFDVTEVLSIAFMAKEDENVPYSKLREFAKQMEDYCYNIEGVAKIEKFGYYDREYLVEVQPQALEVQRIGLNTVINTLKMRNVDFPGGPLREGEKEYVLRTKGQFKNAEEIRNTVIRGNDVGFILRIKDVAKVTDTFEEADVHHRYNGKEAIIFKLYKKRAYDEIDTAARIRTAVAKHNISGFEDITFAVFNDMSEFTSSRLESVIDNAVVGFCVLTIFIMLMLGRRMTGIVMLAIPLTFMLTFICMKITGLTLNIISMFGIIMVLGMVVDFSIVVTENSYRYKELGLSKKDAVSKGIVEIFGSVTVTLLCIITAFMPLLLIGGMMGKFINAIPVVIIISMIASWAVAFFILPTCLNLLLSDNIEKEKKPLKDEITPLSAKKKRVIPKEEEIEGAKKEKDSFEKIQNVYRKFLTYSLKHRYITIAIMILIFIISLSLIPGLGFKFMTAGGEEQIRITVRLPFETNLAANLKEMKKMESIILETVREDEFKSLHLYVGEEFTIIIDPKPGKATYKSTFDIKFVPEKERKRICDEITAEIRNTLQEKQAEGAFAKEISFKVEIAEHGPPVGKPVNVELRGKNFTELSKIADEYVEYLQTIDGVYDINVDLEEGKTEYHYRINEQMAALTGASTQDIANALNASYLGAVATKVNQFEESVGVRVRFDEKARINKSSLADVKITNNTGGLIPLNRVSNMNITSSYSHINRLNFERLVQVQAEVDIKKTTPLDVEKKLVGKFHDIHERYPNSEIAYGGESEDTDKSVGELGTLFIIALMVILFMLILYYNSIMIPIIVMIAIPFVLVGIVFALYTHGQPLSFMSMLGMFSLAGVIVSNTLVLVSFINGFREEGKNLMDSLIEGGVVRLRPILLTAGTTILSLLPTVYGFGGKDYMVAPLALAFAYGLLFATFITLILVPCFYHVAEDIKWVVAGKLAKIRILKRI
ncbi:MAG: efflux RND transporter permease subunit [Leptospirales bacterium]|nr:efflux RND transporter permease subunit [Leptospirales bacterium]